MTNDWKAFSQQDFRRGVREVWVRKQEGERIITVESPIICVNPNPGELRQPLFTGPDTDAVLQALLDHAWELGLRPRGFFDTTNQVAAMQAHMADLRALVFKGKVQPK